MKQVPNDHEIIITDDKDLFVEVNYRCFFEPNKCFAPMCVSGSIYNGHTLQDFIKQGKEDYENEKEKDGTPKWLKVEAISVFVEEN